jgi:hypothetical protein
VNYPVWKKFSTKLRRFLVQSKGLLQGKSEFIRHNESQILGVFQKHSLEIVEKKRLDTGRGGYAYYIYHLVKQ